MGDEKLEDLEMLEWLSCMFALCTFEFVFALDMLECCDVVDGATDGLEIVRVCDRDENVFCPIGGGGSKGGLYTTGLCLRPALLASPVSTIALASFCSLALVSLFLLGARSPSSSLSVSLFSYSSLLCSAGFITFFVCFIYLLVLFVCFAGLFGLT